MYLGEARIRLELESLVQVNPRYKTLFYGLKRNHPHSAAVVHPLLFMLRRLVYAAIAIFCLSVPIVGVFILSLTCVIMLGYVLVEQQWEDQLIARQHIVNEVALYFILLLVMMCALPLAPSMLSPIGWAIISLTIAIQVFNLAIIFVTSAYHLILYQKRN